MEDLLSEFIGETREMLEALSGGIVAWETAPGDRARLDEIFRFVHTVKGNSGFFDLPRIEALSHAAEDSLAQVRSGSRAPDHALVSAVLAIIDRIGELIQDLETGQTLASGDDSALIAALSASEAEAPRIETTTAAPNGARGGGRTVRLPVDLLDRMMSGVSDLVLARNELARRLREIGSTDLVSSFERVSATIADLRNAVTRTRMQRIDSLFAPLPRIVRDLAGETGKQVVLQVDGGDVELDREMIEMIRDPLTHIIRNAVDHGIELPEQRVAAGKPEAGLVTVSARQAGNQIVIEVRDDGRGVDGERLVAKALATGYVDLDRANHLTPAQKIHLIFEAGLSTAAEVTALSGRGVGMDVVRANIERIGGIVDVDSRLGAGVVFSLKVPLTLTIIPALIVGAAGQAFAIPRSAIDEIVRVQGEVRIERIGGAPIASVRGRRLPVIALRAMIGAGESEAGASLSLILLKLAGGRVYALAVEEVRDHEELVVKPAAPAVIAAGLYGGTTLGDDGLPLLLLDPPAIAARARLALDREGEPEAPAAATAPARGRQSLLFRTLAGTKRIAPLAAVERVEEVKPGQIARTGGRMRVTLGDRILPLEGCEIVPEQPIKVLRLTDGDDEIGYAAVEILDIIAAFARPSPAASAGEVVGVLLVDGEQVELLDLHYLFARQLAATAMPERPICLLAGSDPFLETMLRPLVEAAGYHAVRPGDPRADHAAIVLRAADDEDEAPALPEGARVVLIRTADAPQGEKDDSIHRYDRDAIVGALAGRSGKRRRKA